MCLPSILRFIGGSLTTGMAFGVPPIIKFGDEQLKARYLPDLLTGKKRTCIAITVNMSLVHG